MSLIQQLASGNYIIVNKTLIKELGLVEAVLLGELCTEYCYWESINQLDDGMFYATIEKIAENTGLSAYEQRKAISSLESNGIIETEVKGLPARKYFRINESQLLNFSQLGAEKLHSSNNITSNNDNTDNTNVLSTENSVDDFLVSEISKKSKAKKPTLYSNCMALIDDFTKEQDVRDSLKDFLNMRLANKDKPFGANTFKGMLKKLRTLTDSKEMCIKIIQQATDRCYLTFYPLSNGRQRGCPEIISKGEKHQLTDYEYEEAMELDEKF